jgi:HAD superfamily hydrolase (TIGR01509 family)
MIKAIVFDFSRVLLFPINKDYRGSLNELHKKHVKEKDYSVFHLFQLNTDLLQQIEKIAYKTRVYILSSETIQESPEFQIYLHQFKKIYSASEIGFSKKDSQLYKYILNDLHRKPDEVLFIDDSEENISAAQDAGLEATHYKNNQQLLDKLKEYASL